MWCCSEAPRARSARIDAVRCTMHGTCDLVRHPTFVTLVSLS